ncbi:MAG: hypothetical protein ISS36_00360 [Candidatus Aenigmarchaeota archaeon]|nr:hypothetical protein [Candidatus Aenigmarchaeota archaeon]
MGKFNKKFGLICFLFVSFAFLHYVVPVLSVNSISGLFNVTPNTLVLNWTNNYTANITLIANQSQNDSAFNITLDLYNVTGITSNYSQVSQYLNNYSNCFQSNQYIPLKVINASNTSILTNTTTLPNGTNETFTIVFNSSCPPGKYYGYIRVANTSNTSDHVNITTTIDVLITTNNELNTTTGIGAFKGTMPVNASAYHSFYFNVSEIYNARGITINISWNDTNKDLDMFLFNNSLFASKSAGKSTNSEVLNYSYLTPGLWEIRLYGNFTAAENYTGNLYFTSLNLTNTSNNNTIYNLSFGEMNISENTTVNITLRNDGNLTSLSTVELKRFYHLDRSNSTIANNYTFTVPSYATRVKTLINWTDGTNYTLSLYLPNGTLVSNSTGKRVNANVTGAMQEEFIETTSITKGIWRAEVLNNTVMNGNYTIDLMFFVNTWLSSNYTTTSLNITNVSNYTKNFALTFTIPNTSISGLYQGFFDYRDSRGAILSTPLSVNVTTGTLLVNSTFESDTVQIRDNIGFNRSGTDLQISIPINNTGNRNITSINCTNSTNLTSSSYGINFSYSCPNNLTIGSSTQMEINFTVDTNETGNREGVYAGWIYLNATDAYPYQGFNLTVQVNLTNDLIVNITQIKTADGNTEIENVSRAENITIFTNVSLLNNTLINALQLENFTVWLVENNVTTYRYPTSSSSFLTEYNGTSPLYSSNIYNINVSIPTGIPGGKYRVYVNASYIKDNLSFSGSNYNYPLTINRTGLNITFISNANRTTNEDTVIYYNMSVVNFGNLPATGNITLSTCSTITPVLNNKKDGCGSYATGSNVAQINITENGTEICWYYWSLTAGNVSSTTACPVSITATDNTYSSISGGVSVVEVSTSSGNNNNAGTGDSCSSNSTCASNQYCDTSTSTCKAVPCSLGAIVNHICIPDSLLITEHVSFLSGIPGGSNFTKIRVNNTGQRAILSKLDIDISSDITASVAPASCSLGLNASCVYNVTFNISNTSSLGNHSGKFIAYENAARDTIKNEKTFLFDVMVTTERLEGINESYYSLLSIFSNLSTEFRSIVSYGVVPSENLTEVERLLNSSNEKLTSALTAINNENYATAETILTELTTTLNSTLTELERVKSEFKEVIEKAAGAWWLNPWLWVGVTVAIIVAVLLLYLLLPPPSGYSPQRGFSPKKNRSENIKRAVHHVKKRVKSATKRKKKRPWQK